ncbi:MAG: peptidoglycan DD-metalloendopeptidase family protein [Clostridia bacterium]|nr:peptidoglycan DD-metalloendopeptidase family protein [Clostridia bacterium]
MFTKINAVISDAAKSVAKTAISALNKTVHILNVLGTKTVKFFKVNIVNTLTSSKRFAVVVGGIGVAACVVLAMLFANFNTIAVSVITNGQIVGYVSDSSELDDIMSSVANSLTSDEDLTKVDDIKFGLAVVSKSVVENGADLAISVLEAQDDFSSAAGLYVNGEFVVSASDQKVITNALENLKNKYVTADTKSVSFLEEVAIKTVYYTDETAPSDDVATTLISNGTKVGLNVQTTSLVSSTKTIEYDVVTKHDSNRVVGYNRISVLGKDGSAEVKELVTSVNGSEVETVVVDEKVVETPINQIIVKGTSTNGMSTVQKTLTSKGISFLWPIAVTSDMYISSTWGDGRGHHGIDITGDYGTPIYASYEGTVAYAGWSGEYGYLIVINHKGGYQTAYAHMSSIYVKAGQTVKTGEVIAGCGSTGVATGDHVHFEVRIGGTRVNPAPYLGLGY